MSQSPSHPPYTSDEARARETFLALMWASSYPGRIYTLPDVHAFVVIGEALLDLETSYYTNDDQLAPLLARNGARRQSPERAAYHFYPTLTDADLPAISAAAVGEMLYPDRSATLIIGCSFDTDARFSLSGAGVNGTTAIQVGALSADFWELRESRRRYPLGWDIFLIDGARVLALPRSTTMIRENA
ncbi:MAG: phosphonate C-P lyase system protein PhnH [Chloroflexota bacterium]|nr:phosphonate C-P lyase system protein PhnH [Chloroflexota bacterium]